MPALMIPTYMIYAMVANYEVNGQSEKANALRELCAHVGLGELDEAEIATLKAHSAMGRRVQKQRANLYQGVFAIN